MPEFHEPGMAETFGRHVVDEKAENTTLRSHVEKLGQCGPGKCGCDQMLWLVMRRAFAMSTNATTTANRHAITPVTNARELSAVTAKVRGMRNPRGDPNQPRTDATG